MAMPPPIPISNPQSESQPPIATPAFRAFASRLSATVRHAFSQRRPWLELLDRSSFSRPDSLAEAASRIRRNFSYFRVNYLSLLALSISFSLLSHPFSLLLLLALLGAWLFLYAFRPSDQPVVVAGRAFSDREMLGILVVSTVVVVFLTSVGSLLISALLAGLAVVCAHGAFRMPEDLFLDEQEPIGSEFLSFLGACDSDLVRSGRLEWDSTCKILRDLQIGAVREVNVKSGLPATTSKERLELMRSTFSACGLSMVITSGHWSSSPFLVCVC